MCVEWTGLTRAPPLSSTIRSASVRSLVCRIGVGEAHEVVLVQVHDDQLVCGRQVHRHLGELFVKVARVPTGFLRGDVRKTGRQDAEGKANVDQNVRKRWDERKGKEEGKWTIH